MAQYRLCILESMLFEVTDVIAVRKVCSKKLQRTLKYDLVFSLVVKCFIQSCCFFFFRLKYARFRISEL